MIYKKNKHPDIIFIDLGNAGYCLFSSCAPMMDLPNFKRLMNGGARYKNFYTNPDGYLAEYSLNYGRFYLNQDLSNLNKNNSLVNILSNKDYRVGVFGRFFDNINSLSKKFAGAHSSYLALNRDFNHFSPMIYRDFSPDLKRKFSKNYYFYDDLFNSAINFIESSKNNFSNPFFAYISLSAGTPPYQSLDADNLDTDLKFNDWYKLVENSIKAQSDSLLLHLDYKDQLSNNSKLFELNFSFYKRQYLFDQFKLYYSLLKKIDNNLGNLLDYLDSKDLLSSTPIILTFGVNGFSSSQDMLGYFNNYHNYSNASELKDDLNDLRDHLGTEKSYPSFSFLLSHIVDAPFFLNDKDKVNAGNLKGGLLVHWPDFVRDRGYLREQNINVADIMPTILSISGSSISKSFQKRLDGVDIYKTLNNKHHNLASDNFSFYNDSDLFYLLKDKFFHFHWNDYTNFGNKSSEPFFYYDARNDPSLKNKIRGFSLPKKDLEPIFKKIHANSSKIKSKKLPYYSLLNIDLSNNTSFFSKDLVNMLDVNTFIDLKNKSYKAYFNVLINKDKSKPCSGVLYAQGGRHGGWSLYIHKNKLFYIYNYFGKQQYIVTAPDTLRPGSELLLGFDFDFDFEKQSAKVTLSINKNDVASGFVDKIMPYSDILETADFGVDLITPVNPQVFPDTRSTFFNCNINNYKFTAYEYQDT